jgi:hypothetical protein
VTPLNQRNDRYSTVVDVAVHLPTECLSTAQVEARTYPAVCCRG